MSGFVEKLFDSFTGQDNQNQQQQQSQPQLPPGWISQWDDRENRYIYINEQTGERSWDVPQQGEFLPVLPFPLTVPPKKLTPTRFLPRCRRMDRPPRRRSRKCR